MQRRKFLQALGTTLMASPLASLTASADEPNKPAAPQFKDLRRITIPVGATQPFRALHIADTHITHADSREDARKTALAESRGRHFNKADYYLQAALQYVERENIMLLHTGDFYDFVSQANLEAAAASLPASRCFVCAGNHEYSQYVGEAREDEAYKDKSRLAVQNAMPNDLRMASRVVNGVNFIALDDVYYNFTDDQLRWMKKQVRRRLPIVLLLHVPIYTPEHCQTVLKENNGLAGYMTGAPLDITSTYYTDPSLPAGQEWRNRSVQQRADEPTLRFIKWLRKQRLLKAILCGHCHEFFQERFSPSAIQYTVGSGYSGAAYEIEFV